MPVCERGACCLCGGELNLPYAEVGYHVLCLVCVEEGVRQLAPWISFSPIAGRLLDYLRDTGAVKARQERP